MWSITRIEDADYGCEERLPGEPLMVLVTIEREDGVILQFEVSEDWIMMQGLDEGDEWPEDVEAENPNDINAANQAEWLENYYCALEEMEEL